MLEKIKKMNLEKSIYYFRTNKKNDVRGGFNENLYKRIKKEKGVVKNKIN